MFEMRCRHCYSRDMVYNHHGMTGEFGNWIFIPIWKCLTCGAIAEPLKIKTNRNYGEEDDAQ